ncbi:B12-binding domain-containing radical SAM protein [Arcticibacter tournemirensis]|uniref:Radical SAM protein n=1 Tax=Arcticibacter tournemirensis TaxID=699437 RepID=A0A4Q0M8N6_9SPHI|nr:radical SAM protein [Arcticibacter tournemirensis]RXF69415.1 radical SAM protein [Arcticibacter tournemirensis]
MKILLLNPPFLDKYSKSSRSPAVTKSATIYFPLWLSYAAGVLDKEGYELKIVDAPAKCISKEETLKLIRSFNPDFVVIDTSTASINNDLNYTKTIKEALPKVKTCLVGTHVSACVSETLPRCSEYVDFIARHEYDYTLPEIVKVIEGKKALADVRGISYCENGVLKETPDREYIQDLDELPFVSEVYKKYLDIKDYFYAHVSYPTVSIFSSRGCPSKCFYCMYSQVMFGKKYRKRSAKSLYDECIYITKEFPEVKEILIDDDNFAVNQKNVREFCQMMINNQVKLKWVVQCRVNLSYDTMVLMKKAGCRLVVVGYESGSQKVLDGMQKGITLKQSKNFNDAAKKAHMRVHGCFMVGNPGETKETMMQTLNFAKSLRMDTVQFFPLMLYPGTEAYKWAKDNNSIIAESYDEWLIPDGTHNCVLSTPEVSSKELVEFCDYARREFYLRPRYLLMKAGECLTNWDDLRRTLKAFGTFRKYLFK